ncbi:hypothetical protein N431DRAFT_425474 [Stipitochalara longipes BDJ]|nr:hypothetical protein N431DRAFT_425474 [Stipitochalara longipes BDJ]
MFAALASSSRDLVARVWRPQIETQQHETTAKGPLLFFTLPPEIRHHIYRLVMFSADDKRWIHTAKLPLLECSRRFNEDATPIFYRENVFSLEWFVGKPSLLQVWSPSSPKFSLITKMIISRNMQANNIAETLPRFPALWEVELNLGTAVHRGTILLSFVRTELERLQNVTLVLLIQHNKELSSPWDILRTEYAKGYGDVLDVPEGYLKNRAMRLNYQAPTGNYSKLGAPGILRLTYEREKTG